MFVELVAALVVPDHFPIRLSCRVARHRRPRPLYLPTEVDAIKPDTPLFWSTFGRRGQGLVRRPMDGKNVWRLCKTYGRLIGYPMLKPHDLRHGVAMEVYERHGDLEQVRALLGHTRIDTTQLYAQIRPAALKQAVEFYEAKALDVLGT